MSEHLRGSIVDGLAPILAELRARLRTELSPEYLCAIETAVTKASIDASNRTVIEVAAQVTPAAWSTADYVPKPCQERPR